MKPTQTNNYSVKARCPDCNGAVSVFNYNDSGREFGLVLVDGRHVYDGKSYGRIHWRILKCSGCGRAGLAKFHDDLNPAVLESFHPRALASADIPDDVPEGIRKEFREAELCMSVEAWRAASALLRSTLEKTLKINGYVKGTLQQKIDEAADDGVITAARKQKAHDDIRVLGNEVVHEEWRDVTEEEVESAMHYAQRILEDFYDDRTSVEKIISKKINRKK